MLYDPKVTDVPSYNIRVTELIVIVLIKVILLLSILYLIMIEILEMSVLLLTAPPLFLDLS